MRRYLPLSWKHKYDESLEKNPCRPRSNYTLDFHANILVASHGNINIMDFQERILASH